jgi:N-acetylneuraminate synthase
MINDRKDNKNKVYIIAEAGVNHNGSIEMAKQLVDVAVNAGADAVKFQTFKAEKMISRYAPKAAYQRKTTTENESQLEMVKKLEMDEDAHSTIIEYCRCRNIQFLSTPFDFDSIDLLAKKFDLPCLKISSGDITNGPFLLKAARTGKNIILSTGMSSLGEVEEALDILAFGYTGTGEKLSVPDYHDACQTEKAQFALKKKVKLLHCTSEYPAPFDEVNLRVLLTMHMAFGLPVGLSDHTLGITVPIAAVALGAQIIEKHFTLDKKLPGPDHKASLEPSELLEMVKAIRHVEMAIGHSRKIPTSSESKNRNIGRKSLVAAKTIQKGDIFTPDNLAIKRPGTGISPMRYWDLLGQHSTEDYSEDELIKQ